MAYTGHTHNTTVARISPTGYYCASADVTGTGAPHIPMLKLVVSVSKYILVSASMGYCRRRSDSQRIIQSHRWSHVRTFINYEDIQSAEYSSLCSNDLEWDGESKRIIAVGDGREKYVLLMTALTYLS